MAKFIVIIPDTGEEILVDDLQEMLEEEYLGVIVEEHIEVPEELELPE